VRINRAVVKISILLQTLQNHFARDDIAAFFSQDRENVKFAFTQCILYLHFFTGSSKGIENMTKPHLDPKGPFLLPTRPDLLTTLLTVPLLKSDVQQECDVQQIHFGACIMQACFSSCLGVCFV